MLKLEIATDLINGCLHVLSPVIGFGFPNLFVMLFRARFSALEKCVPGFSKKCVLGFLGKI